MDDRGSRATPTATVRAGVLVCTDGTRERQILVGTPDWFTWVEDAVAFTFTSDAGGFRARKERFQRGGHYWKAYRKQHGKVFSAYLGQSARLTAERLLEIAGTLAVRGANDGMTPAVGGRRAARRAVASAESDALFAVTVGIPPVREDVIPRARLAALLDDGVTHALTLVSAPAGSGKTTLLSAWSRDSQRPVAWVALDPGDDDPARFWRHVLAAIASASADHCQPLAALLRVRPSPPAETLLVALLNAMAPLAEPVILILDDYHVITAQSIHESIEFLLEHLPSALHLALASRTTPPLALARLRTRGHLREIGAGELRFTNDEALLFFQRVHHLHLSEDDLRHIETQVEGWIAGLQLAGLSLRGSNDIAGTMQAFMSGSHRSLTEYFMEEALSGLPEDIQGFVLETAILDQLSGPLCDAVTGRKTGQADLEWLERSNLFLIPLDEQRRWYRFHHLFANFLRSRLDQLTPTRVPILRRRAAAWCERAGYREQAVGHALAAGDFPHAADLIEQVAHTLVEQGETVTLQRWLDLIPAEHLHANPPLCLVRARVLVIKGDIEAAETHLQHAERTLMICAEDAEDDERQDGASDKRRAALGRVAGIRAEIANGRGDFAEASEQCQRALAALPEGEVYLRTEVAAALATARMALGETESAMEAYAQVRAFSHSSGNISAALGGLSAQGFLHLLLGQLHEAEAVFEQGRRLAQVGGSGAAPFTSLIYLGLGRVRYEWNELDVAGELIAQAVALSTQWGDALVLMRSLATLARLKYALGDCDGARAVLQQLDPNLTDIRFSPRIADLAAANCVRLRLAWGERNAATRWERACGVSPADALSYAREFSHLTLARVLLAQRRLDEARALLERLHAAADAAGRLERVIEALLLMALTVRASGDPRQALAILGRAVVLAEPGGYVRTFADEGPLLAALLAKLVREAGQSRACQEGRPSPSYLTALLNASAPQTCAVASLVAGAARARPSALLSAREMTLLRLLAAGRSDHDMAQELVLELSTIKWHLAHLYRKLGVRSRTQAVACAHTLNLV